MKYKEWIEIQDKNRKVVQKALELGFNPSFDPIEPGDLYLAFRNTQQLLTCKSVNERGYIVPEENGQYPFDWDDCIKIED